MISARAPTKSPSPRSARGWSAKRTKAATASTTSISPIPISPALSPLADPDLDLHAGDIIEAINGEPVLSQPDPQLMLRDQQGRQVLLRIRRQEEKRRDVIVKPVADEADLRYRDWTYRSRQRVETAGHGKIGYVHLRAMTNNDLSEWYSSYYPVFNRQGLIVDVRHNRGGNIDSIILEKLMRKAWFFWKDRTSVPTWNMQYAFRGHVVVLCDENTASDGEAFTEGFRRLGLGKVIGTRTWGGEIWLGAQNTLSDGGVATAAEEGVYGPERKWLIEGRAASRTSSSTTCPTPPSTAATPNSTRPSSTSKAGSPKTPAPYQPRPPIRISRSSIRKRAG